MEKVIAVALRTLASGRILESRFSHIEGEPVVRVSVDTLTYLGEKGADGSGTVQIGDGWIVPVDGESYKGYPNYRGPVPEGDEELYERTGYTHFDVWAQVLLEAFDPDAQQ